MRNTLVKCSLHQALWVIRANNAHHINFKKKPFKLFDQLMAEDDDDDVGDGKKS